MLRLWCRLRVVPVVELTEVVVRERRRHACLEVDLVTRGQTKTCPGGRLGPLRRVESQALAEWLSEPLSRPVCRSGTSSSSLSNGSSGSGGQPNGVATAWDV